MHLVMHRDILKPPTVVGIDYDDYTGVELWDQKESIRPPFNKMSTIPSGATGYSGVALCSSCPSWVSRAGGPIRRCPPQPAYPFMFRSITMDCLRW